MPEKKYTLDDLLLLMRKLRDPNTGCPWDIKQTYKSITPCTIEEAYEVVDAIDKEDYPHLKEELGDLLFQVIFYSQLGKEDNYFDFSDVVNNLTEKLVRRHPHVFPSGDLFEDPARSMLVLSDEEIKNKWEKIKQQERGEKGKVGILDDVPIGLPGLTRAAKLQKRAAKVGFDWKNTDQVFAKLREEIDELEYELKKDETSEASLAELGDVFFSCVNIARFLKADSESIMRKANQKFETRFRYIETHAPKPLKDMTIGELEALWQVSKQHE